MKRKLLSLLLALALLLTLLPQAATPARAEDAPVYSGECGDNLTWTFDPDTGTLTIEGSGEMWGYYGDVAPWADYAEAITAVSLPEGLENIGGRAFENCTGLSSVSFPESLTEIYGFAFAGCTGLTFLSFQESVSYLGWDAFSGCTGLRSVTVLNPLCQISDSSFEDCDALTISGYSGSSAEHFASLQGFPFVSLGSFWADGVCGNFLTWSFDHDTGTLTIDGLYDMWDFEPDYDPAPWYDFRDEITTVCIKEGVESVGSYSFADHTALTSVLFPEGFYLIMDYAFADCTGLTSLDFPDSLMFIVSSAFSGCTGLTSVVFPEAMDTLGGFDGCTGLTSVSLPEHLVYLDHYAFTDCTALESVTFPDSLEGIGVCAFEGCSSLTSLILPENLNYLDLYVFRDCTSLTSVSFPDSLEEISYGAFWGCTSLSTVSLPSNLKRIEQTAFLDCTSLSSVIFPDGLEKIDDDAFNGCENLSTVTLPTNLKSIGHRAFKNCTGLSSVTFQNNLKKIGNGAFMDCDGLRSVTLPGSLDMLGYHVFIDCDNLKNLVFRNPACKVDTYYRVEHREVINVGKSEIIPETVKTQVDVNEYGDWYVLYEGEYYDTLGFIENVIVYAPHDPEKEDASIMILETDESDEYRFTYGYRYIENCAKTFGYTFYATNVFSDVKEGKFYEIPVAWAYGEGITSGKDETHFAPNETCTRGQVVTFLWNAMGNPAPTITDCPFVDVKPGKFYYDAMLWALETGVTSGKDETHFAPNESCTRGQVVTFIWNAMGKPEPTITDCPFVDVTPGKYYYNAMLWALENGITAGLDETHFGPNQTCTRGQVVTFLYNALS